MYVELPPTPLCPPDRPQILVAVFTGVPAADDPPADFGDDIGPLVDFDLFPNRERADELEENGGVEVTFRQFQQVCRARPFALTFLTFIRSS